MVNEEAVIVIKPRIGKWLFCIALVSVLFSFGGTTSENRLVTKSITTEQVIGRGLNSQKSTSLLFSFFCETSILANFDAQNQISLMHQRRLLAIRYQQNLKLISSIILRHDTHPSALHCAFDDESEPLPYNIG